MNKQLFALFIHNPSEHFERLRETLKQLSIHTYSVSTCKQAEHLLSHDLIFSENCLEDGSG
jgi:hypothetical protein